MSNPGSKPLLKALVALLATICLGEGYALYAQYQSNIYQREYLSQNATQV